MKGPVVQWRMVEPVFSPRSIDWDPVRRELRTVAEDSPLLVWITEADGYCIYVNTRWREFTGQQEGESEGDGWVNALHQDDREMAREAFLNAVSRRRAYQVEYRLCRPAKTFSWVLAVGHPYFTTDGKLGGYVGSDASLEGLTERSRNTEKVLTPREREVLQLVSQGKTSIDIAELLAIAARTVEQHVQSSMLKLGATNRVQAAVEAVRRGEFDKDPLA